MKLLFWRKPLILKDDITRMVSSHLKNGTDDKRLFIAQLSGDIYGYVMSRSIVNRKIKLLQKRIQVLEKQVASVEGTRKTVGRFRKLLEANGIDPCQ